MQAVSTQSPLINRARQEAVFLSSSLIDRCVEAALAALEGAERSAKSVALRLQLGEAMAALTKRRAEVRAGIRTLAGDPA